MRALSLSSFAEVLRDATAPSLDVERVGAAGGGVLTLQLTPTLSAGAGGTFTTLPSQSRALGQVHGSFALRPRGGWLTAVVGQADARLLRDPARDAERQQVARAQLTTTLGQASGLSAQWVAGARVGRQLLAATRSGVLASSVRLGLPVWRLQPVVEVGGRVLLSSASPLTLDGTLRTELLMVMGGLRAGLGVVLAGYRGGPLEDASQSAPQRVYAVFRGAL